MGVYLRIRGKDDHLFAGIGEIVIDDIIPVGAVQAGKGGIPQ